MRPILQMSDDMEFDVFMGLVTELPNFQFPNRPRFAARLLQIAARRAKDGDPEFSQFYNDNGNSLTGYTDSAARNAFPLPDGY